MRVYQESDQMTISYACYSVVSLSCISAMNILNENIFGIFTDKPQGLSIWTGLTILFIGLINGFVSWTFLSIRLGICPGLYHSTLCIPSIKNDKLQFKSSRILEYGILNGLIDAGYYYSWTQTSNKIYIFCFNLLSFASLFIIKSDYYRSDLIGMFLLAISHGLILSYSFPSDYPYEIILLILICKVILLNKFKGKFEESRSLSIVSLTTQGLVLSIIGYFFSISLTFESLILGFLYSLFTYTLIEASITEKPAIVLSILSIQIWTNADFSIIPVLLALIGGAFLLIGRMIFSFCSTRMNSVVFEDSSLNQRFL
ncbi:hypothetical protein SteCoe_20428 [Stentor coeruleus]|uniref:Uncharacterized protein n=1 Tax=Stentor coeruleus TaxID=5963 RepID=A0A1R2BS11_9CILI|nr:hypothetical protein SteCoe_20428 [Stentor coeruleus]